MLLKIAGISRSVYYYYISKKDIDEKNKDVIEKIKEIYYANKGNINLEDNVSNALGMFVNINSDMANEGTIQVSAIAPKVSNKYQFNVAMRADQADIAYEGTNTKDTEVINKNSIKCTAPKILDTRLEVQFL